MLLVPYGKLAFFLIQFLFENIYNFPYALPGLKAHLVCFRNIFRNELIKD